MDRPETTPSFRRDGFPPGPIYELQYNGRVLLYANRTIEFFRNDIPPNGEYRWHVDLVGVDIKPKRNGDFRIKIGQSIGEDIFAPATFDFPPERMPDVEAFFDAVKKEREKGQ